MYEKFKWTSYLVIKGKPFEEFFNRKKKPSNEAEPHDRQLFLVYKITKGVFMNTNPL